jgi:HSP20 family molecular chaperone IbpA
LKEKKKQTTLTVLIFALLLVCVIQGFFLLKDTDFTFSWRKAKDTNFDTFSQSLLDEYKQDKKDHWDRFDQFFDDDFFRGRNDPFQEMEDMQNRMREMMENSFQGSFNDSWDGWFSSRFHKNSDAISIQTEEKEDSVIITINIPNLKENNLNVTIDTSGVHIEAEVERVVEKKDSDENIITSSTVQRKIDQTFPIPQNTDYEKAHMEYTKDKVIITLPKRG